MASEAVYVLPGDTIDDSLIPQHPKHPLRIGPGLRHVPPSDLIPSIAGALLTDKKKNSIWVEQGAGRVRTPDTTQASQRPVRAHQDHQPSNT
ncbi:MAG: hypothetical protein IMZ46_16490, partial [Acidobacteria bacterium]|nr:hypothetical protein [Acidobacteriota bacterium]